MHWYLPFHLAFKAVVCLEAVACTAMCHACLCAGTTRVLGDPHLLHLPLCCLQEGKYILEKANILKVWHGPMCGHWQTMYALSDAAVCLHPPPCLHLCCSCHTCIRYGDCILCAVTCHDGLVPAWFSCSPRAAWLNHEC